jgi:hypothetical protein
MNASKLRNLGTLSLANYGRKHAERLRQHPDASVAQRAEVVSAAVSDLENAFAARRPLVALWSAETEKKDAADDSLDDYIRAISYDLLAPGLLNGDRAHAQYRALFPDGTVRFVDGPDREQLAHVAGMAKFLKDHPDHPMAGRRAGLLKLAAKLETALDAVAAAEAAVHSAWQIERDKREVVIRTLRKSATFLRDYFDGDEAKVDALFPTLAEARVPDAERDEEPAIPKTPTR